jgi:outer membrane protein OmpA-like peptidoglycan-associated protein
MMPEDLRARRFTRMTGSTPSKRSCGTRLSVLLAGFAAIAGIASVPQAAAANKVATASAPRALRRELDGAEALLRARLAALPEDSGVVLAREPQRVILRIPARLLFQPDSADFKPQAAASLPIVAAVQLLKKRRRLDAQIAVYTDSIGGTAANQNFSEQRAHAVESALSGAGVPAARLQHYGAGQNSPISTNDTPEGRTQNRRVEIAFEWAAAGATSGVRPAPAAAP